MKKIIFIGCVESSYIFLNELIKKNAEIVGVITKSKSNFNSDFMDLSPLCKDNSIPYIFVDNVNDDETVKFIKNLKPDIGFCFGWSQLVKKNIIDLFPEGMLGFHPAELPNNRGRHPLIWALVLGLDKTASTFFQLDDLAADRNSLSRFNAANRR